MNKEKFLKIFPKIPSKIHFLYFFFFSQIPTLFFLSLTFLFYFYLSSKLKFTQKIFYLSEMKLIFYLFFKAFDHYKNTKTTHKFHTHC
uniref:Uncharacterized protein n=1 Tax=Meloidogyne enterolobii TaxID=390850 RepID=A0A6V7ULU9_MELEN|nr:unnamed protein product [Meloidogyne enterolobii]